jgi:hypothetical protein
LNIPWDAAELRTPVLAIGSNAGPEQLLRKYPPELFPAGVAIPCVRCMLPGFDVAFAPLLSSYGFCTGSLLNTTFFSNVLAIVLGSVPCKAAAWTAFPVHTGCNVMMHGFVNGKVMHAPTTLR